MLIPRSETEVLVGLALKHLPQSTWPVTITDDTTLSGISAATTADTAPWPPPPPPTRGNSSRGSNSHSSRSSSCSPYLRSSSNGDGHAKEDHCSINDGIIRVLDIGTGSGAIALAMLDECPQAHVTAIDNSCAAVSLARHNAARLGLDGRLEVVHVDGGVACYTPRAHDNINGSDISNKSKTSDKKNRRTSNDTTAMTTAAAAAAMLTFDVVISNPPYVTPDEMEHLAPELAYEDRGALCGGGELGLDVVGDILKHVPAWMRIGAPLWLELGGPQQVRTVAMLAPKASGGRLAVVETHSDLEGVVRFVRLDRTTMT